uniref:Putative tail tubular protein n=1 Tax=viral metagenome TaxID=1070528 RepID=A0A6H1ZMJ0_9ZZZZ
MTTASDILSAVQSRVFRDDTTFSSTTTPTQTEVLRWLTEDVKTITGICAQEKSELGRTQGSITTRTVSISAITAANPGAVTTSSVHGLTSNDTVLIKSVEGMTEVNDLQFTATVVDTTSFTIGVNTSAYTAYSSGGTVYPVNYTLSNILGINKFGWVLKTNARNKINLINGIDLVDYSPSSVSEPEAFYIDESGDISFCDTADAAYTIKIPYWAVATVIDDTTDTVPFKGVFDNLLIESLSIRILNRDEYDLSHELDWFKFLMGEARKIVRMRQNPTTSVGL